MMMMMMGSAGVATK